MRSLLVLGPLLLAGCGVGDGGAACESIALQVQVIDTFGGAVDGATVNIDNTMPCAGSTGGAYSCALPGAGSYTLYATYPPEFAPYGNQITATCDVDPMSVTVTLNDENGGL